MNKLTKILCCIMLVSTMMPEIHCEPGTSSERDKLIAQIRSKSLKEARLAIAQAIKTQDLEALLCGLQNNSMDARLETVEALGSFPPSSQRTALLAVLGDDEFWREVRGGEASSIQESCGKEVKKLLVNFSDQSVTNANLFSKTVRKTIINSLGGNAGPPSPDDEPKVLPLLPVH